jgi:TonB family protein
MKSERVFQIALLVSIVFHGVMLSQNTLFNFHLKGPEKKETKPELSYLKTEAPPKETQKPLSVKKDPILKLPPNISADTRVPPPFVDKENTLKNNLQQARRETFLDKPAFAKPDTLAIKKKITLPPIDMNQINNPNYIGYYQIVREKIKRCAYQNYTGQETGEVTMLFLVASDGTLQELQLVEDKSSNSGSLRQIALNSVRDASPFPVFPKELDYPQLSFNLAITFEVE